MKNYIIELRGVEFHNKGAELMLYAILEKLRQELPEAIFVMEKRGSAPIASQRKVGIHTKLNMKKFGIDTAFWGQLIPMRLLRSTGFVLEKDIDVVLDGSGFAFGDFWGAEKAGTRLANHIENWRQQGKKIIMLSQAFGPFEDSALKEKMKIIVNNSNLVFARDKYSLSYLKNISATQNNIHLKPDFTNLLKGSVPDYYDPAKYEVAIIPNNKLLESNTFNSRENYVEFLNEITEIITASGKSPYFLIHEGVKDLKLATDVNKTFIKEIPILTVENPLEVKGIIGKSYAVVTSRFHGLVSALSQSVPCLCVGWSHKYLALMEDYNFSEGLIKNDELSGESLKSKLELVLNPNSSDQIHKRLKEGSAVQKELSQSMWNMVLDSIRS
ncbi:polysaccharide pyruvyl transferase family protein [Dyadobacter sp. CY343]|uniref:polysaccharide pyruvyl transferase family protein n=1 Tax=Dyadobacter sp. CY343 TaxID=2907299 RepID=UPI001F250FE9|nr:polysaccharide pyruvyl transferase family protein [Dyadobacter sp. CY343]MCE7059708.1 polysaccharide pyruvyl transferase family protein [Dyadobacter sp. CY343]